MNTIDEILKDYISTTEAAKLYNVTPRSIRDLIYSNKVDFIKVEYKGGFGFKYMVSINSLRKNFSPSWTEIVPHRLTPLQKFKMASIEFMRSILGLANR